MMLRSRTAIEKGRPVNVAALTMTGMGLAQTISRALPESELWAPEAFAEHFKGARVFKRFEQVVHDAFERQRNLVAVMAAGIVVRTLTGHLRTKTEDPAVVVVDERGRFAISLLSGHIGGANEIARQVAGLIGAQPVITTATDARGLPAFDVIATAHGWAIENVEAVRKVHMALLEAEKVRVVDAGNLLDYSDLERDTDCLERWDLEKALNSEGPTVYIGELKNGIPPTWLRLRPKTVVAGIGCNKGTTSDEIMDVVLETFDRLNLSPLCLKTLASIDVKKNEPGLLEAARRLGVECKWYSGKDLSKLEAPNPSDVVEKHVGVPSVSEAAAMLTAQTNELLLPKVKSGNVTLAVARVASPL